MRKGSVKGQLDSDILEVDLEPTGESRSLDVRGVRRSRFMDFTAQWWLMAVVVFVFALVHGGLLISLGAAFDAERELAGVARSDGRGPLMLFMFASGLMGWVIVLTLEHSLGSTGLFQWPIAVFFCAVAVGGGLLLARATPCRLPEGPEGVAVMCVFFAGSASLCRVLYMKLMP